MPFTALGTTSGSRALERLRELRCEPLRAQPVAFLAGGALHTGNTFRKKS
jgi:hypothetical protein